MCHIILGFRALKTLGIAFVGIDLRKTHKNLKNTTMANIRQHPLLFSHLLDDFFPANNAYYPPVNIHENESGFKIELNVPGIKKEEISITSENSLLTIKYIHNEHKEEKNTKIIKKEFSTKSFERTFSLDEKINAEAIEASLENGVLTLTLPMKENVTNPKQLINIK